MKLSIPLADGTTLVYEGTREELEQIGEAFVAKFGSEVGSSSDAKRLGGVTVRVPSDGHLWSEHSVEKLWALLYGEQSKLVKFLIERGGTATYAELKKYMGYDAQKLSGILSPITRNSQTATGDRLARLIDWRIDDAGTRRYFVEARALPLLRKIASKSN
jgi:hypothetical protein